MRHIAARCRSAGPWLLVLLSLAGTALPAGAGWDTLPNAPIAKGRHDDVFFVDQDLGWVVNGYGEIFRTTDGGGSWEPQLLEPSIYFRAVGFANPMKGWVGNLDGNPLLYATTDGGATWTPMDNIPAPRPTGICGIWVVNESVVYACGRYDGPARVIKTTDGGATWTAKDLSPLATTLIDVYFTDADHGFVVGGLGSGFSNRKAVILATSDGGTTWVTRHLTNRTGEWSWKIAFPTPNDGYVSIERFSGQAFFLKSNDGGRTWIDKFFLNGYEEQGIGFATPALGWIGGWTGPTYQTTDEGNTWQLAGFGQNINRFRMLSSTLGYAVGEAVYKYTLDTAGLPMGSAGSPPVLQLTANYPNPFQGSTTIDYGVARESRVRITIHNALGRRVATLADGWNLAGQHSLTWDGRDASGTLVGSGVYWLRLESGGLAESKPLVVAR